MITAAQGFYLGAVGVYLLAFVLFLRFFLWKRYAERHHWHRRPSLDIAQLRALAAARDRDLPMFSIIVPARNEADVIERTIDHLAGLDYPRDRYEVVVVTDEKEVLAHDALRERTVRAAAARLRGEAVHPDLRERAEHLALDLLSLLSLEEVDTVDRSLGRAAALHRLDGLPAARRLRLVHTVAAELVRRRGRIDPTRLSALVARGTGARAPDEARACTPAVLALALPVLACHQEAALEAALRRTARAQHALTREILATLTGMLAARINARVTRLAEGDRLETVLFDLYDDAFPTTQAIVARKRREFRARAGTPRLVHVMVPHDFDGLYPGRRTGTTVASTKGRALNHGLSHIDPATEMCGFYDAESRPDPRVLLHVAYRRLVTGGAVRILQGPVFQMRNFYEMGPFCRIASLYQAVTHDWYLPVLYRRLPFVGGTNLFVERRLLEDIGGYDHRALTEDLELGTRAWLAAGVWPEYLPYPSTEQTPPTFRAFFRQRLRWGSGHLQVMEGVRSRPGYPEHRRRALLWNLWIKGPLEWTLYQAATLVPPTVLVLWWTGNLDPSVLGNWVRWVLNVLSAIYPAFTVYCFYRYAPYLDLTARPLFATGRAGAIAQLFLVPLAAFFFPAPYAAALVLRGLNRQPTAWIKTPRTREC